MKYNPALDGIRALAVLAVVAVCCAFAWTHYGPKTAVLTFDDGPQDARTDAAILAVLRKHHAPAVWFVNCKWLPANRATLRRIVAEGHTVGNHGFDHLPLLTLSPMQLQHEVGGCSDAIRAETGHAPTLFRPPWGRTDAAVDRVVAAEGMRELLWSADSSDHAIHLFRQRPDLYRQFLRDNPAEDVAETAKSGDVILFHDYPNTAATLDATLTRLEARGFRFVSPN